MEIKYTILTQNQETREQQNIGFEYTQDYVKRMLNVLLASIDPNNISDIVIHPVIKK